MILSTDNRLGQTEAMPKVDATKDAEKIRFTDKIYMKRLEEENLIRATKIQRYRKRNRYSGILLGLGVVGIYTYTLYAVKQEKFLDDFEVPQKTIEKST